MIFTRVDFPAPLSPTSPTTSPAFSSKSTLSSACTGPKRLLTSSRLRRGLWPFVSAFIHSLLGPRTAPGDLRSIARCRLRNPSFRLRADPRGLARGHIGPGADVRRLRVAVGDHGRLHIAL